MENGDRPATKNDLTALRDELKGDLVVLRDELTELVRDTETNLLRAFYNYAEAAQKNLADIRRSESVTQDRLVSLETRMLAIEKRLHLPPGA